MNKNAPGVNGAREEIAMGTPLKARLEIGRFSNSLRVWGAQGQRFSLDLTPEYPWNASDDQITQAFHEAANRALTNAGLSRTADWTPVWKHAESPCGTYRTELSATDRSSHTSTDDDPDEG